MRMTQTLGEPAAAHETIFATEVPVHLHLRKTPDLRENGSVSVFFIVPLINVQEYLQGF